MHTQQKANFKAPEPATITTTIEIPYYWCTTLRLYVHLSIGKRIHIELLCTTGSYFLFPLFQITKKKSIFIISSGTLLASSIGVFSFDSFDLLLVCNIDYLVLSLLFWYIDARMYEPMHNVLVPVSFNVQSKQNYQSTGTTSLFAKKWPKTFRVGHFNATSMKDT